MSESSNEIFELALALPQAERVELAYLLLQSLEESGDEIDADDFGAVLRGRVEAYRRGEIVSYSLDEARKMINDRLPKV